MKADNVTPTIIPEQEIGIFSVGHHGSDRIWNQGSYGVFKQGNNILPNRYYQAIKTKLEVWKNDIDIVVRLENKGMIRFPIESGEALSKISINPTGILEESVLRTQTIYSQILDIDEQYVTLECLMNITERTYKQQKVRRTILEGVIPLQAGQLVMIKIIDKAGEVCIKYFDGSGTVTPVDYFNSDIYFQGEFINKPAK